MNKQQITKQYSTILICLALASALILFATPFVSAFEMDLGLIGKSETGMDYIKNLLDQEEYDGIGQDNNYGYSDSDGLFIEDPGIILIMCGFVGILFLFAIVICIMALFSLSHKDPDSAIRQKFSAVKSGLGCSLAYYIFCMYVILESQEWAFDRVFSSDALITTNTYIPLIFQLIVFAASMAVYLLWRKKVVSSIWGGEDYAQTTTSNARIKQAPNYTNLASQSARSEMENLELLKKYKELFDAEIITEEEFNAKKKELLSVHSHDLPDHSNESQTEINQQPRVDPLPRQGQATEFKSTRTCHNCGCSMSSMQTSCSNCGARLIIQDEAAEYSLKWYKFLVYFLLFASAFLNAVSAIASFTGITYEIYGVSADLVYGAFPGMKLVDVLFGVATIGMAIMALITRHALEWNKRKGPRLLCALYVLPGVLNVLYTVAVSAITKVNMYDGYMILVLVGGIVMAIINYIYFKKRKDMFKY